MNSTEDKELEKKIGLMLVLLYREKTDQWLMDVIKPGDEQWHKHNMTAEVKDVAKYINTHYIPRQKIAEALDKDLSQVPFLEANKTNPFYEYIIAGYTEAIDDIRTALEMEQTE